MAKKSMILKQQRGSKFSTRKYNRCKICGRPHAYLRDFGICRICFRELAYKGQIPGVKKASWYTRAGTARNRPSPHKPTRGSRRRRKANRLSPPRPVITRFPARSVRAQE